MGPAEERISVLETRVDGHDRRFVEFGEIARQIDRKIDELRLEIATQFRWIIGIMVTLAGLFAAFGRR